MGTDPAAVEARKNTKAAALLALGTAALVLVWQTATVQVNFGGNWTALFCTGDHQPAPPYPALQPTYRFSHSPGYDGQHYRAVAHDLWLQDRFPGSGIDDPRVRYRRILLPGLAHFTALGRNEWIDTAYLAWVIAAIGLGVFWTARLASHAGWPAAWGLGFVLLPANLVAIDRAVVDGLFCTLTAGAAWYARTRSWRLYPMLAALALTRETGFVIAGAAILASVLGRRWREAAGVCGALAPAMLWYWYVHARTSALNYHFRAFSTADLAALLPSYPETVPFRELVAVADLAALIGIGLLLAGTIRSAIRSLLPAGRAWLRQTPPSGVPCFATIGAAGLTLVALSLLFVYSDHWTHVYSFGRVHSPILILASAAARKPPGWLLVPVLLMVPRTLMQMTPQFLGILRAGVDALTGTP